MFENYPKVRSVLPKEFQDIYAQHYKSNRDGASTASSFAQKMEEWLHKKVAKDVIGVTNKSTLEIGAGTLNQLKYENTQPYDIVEPYTDLFKDSQYKSRIRNIYNDISDIDRSQKYDRITAIATFEHVLDLPKVVATTCILLNPNGTLRISIPNEGTILWKMAYRMTTGVEFRMKYGLDYSILMNHEHVNTADEIEAVLKAFYKSVKCSVFGIHKQLGLYRYYECANADLKVAEDYLSSYLK